MSGPKNTPLDKLKHHVTGAIERGEKEAVEAVVSKTKQVHTPGPWTELRAAMIGPWKIQDGSGVEVCKLDPTNTHNVANARLIAAAPDMLEALKNAELWLGKFIADCGHLNAVSPRHCEHSFKQVLKAIAKATGGES